MNEELKPKQKEVWEMELKFVRGDGQAIPNITTTLGALFTLYAEELGYTRPSHDIEDMLAKIQKRFFWKDEEGYRPIDSFETLGMMKAFLRENFPGDNETTRSTLFPDNVVCPRCCKNINEEKESTWECPVCSVLQHQKCRGDICDLPGGKMLDVEEEIEIYELKGCEGSAIVINDYRVAGPKAWGGGNVGKKWKCRLKDILEALKICFTFSAKPPVGEGSERASAYALQSKSNKRDTGNCPPFAPKRSIKWPEEKEHDKHCGYKAGYKCNCKAYYFNQARVDCIKAHAEGEPIDVERVKEIVEVYEKVKKMEAEAEGSLVESETRTLMWQAIKAVAERFTATR